MKNILKISGKYVLITVIILFSLFVVIGIYVGDKQQEYLDAFGWIAYDKMVSPEMEEEQRLIALRKVDTYGGKTPEETLDLYIEALKKGDIELASKYVVVENQKKEYEDYKKIINLNGGLSKSIEVLSNKKQSGKISCTTNSHCVLDYSYRTEKAATSTGYLGSEKREWVIPAGTLITSNIVFDLNKYTNVWKITN